MFGLLCLQVVVFFLQKCINFVEELLKFSVTVDYYKLTMT